MRFNLAESSKRHQGLDKVLLVDGVVDQLVAIEGLLRGSYEVYTQDTVAQAISQLVETPGIGVIVLPQEMDGMTYQRIMALALEWEPTLTAVVVAQSGDAEGLLRMMEHESVFGAVKSGERGGEVQRWVGRAMGQHAILVKAEQSDRLSMDMAMTMGMRLMEKMSPAVARQVKTTVQVAKHLARTSEFEWPDACVLAATLGQMGRTTLPPSLGKSMLPEQVGKAYREEWLEHLSMSDSILQLLPRGDEIVEMVHGQYDAVEPSKGWDRSDPSLMWQYGSAILRVSMTYAAYKDTSATEAAARHRLGEELAAECPTLVGLISFMPKSESGYYVVRELAIKDLRTGMLTEESISFKGGRGVLVGSGLELDVDKLDSIRRFAAQGRVEEPVRVAVSLVTDALLVATGVVGAPGSDEPFNKTGSSESGLSPTLLSPKLHWRAETSWSSSESERLDHLTAVICKRLNVPVALVSLVQESNDRQVFTGQHGLASPMSELRQTPLSHSFCKLVKSSGRPLVVTDALQDERVRMNPVIKELGVLAYLGVPMVDDDGACHGALCVIDSQPRQWTEKERSVLTNLAEVAVTLLMLRREEKPLNDARRIVDQMYDVIRAMKSA